LQARASFFLILVAPILQMYDPALSALFQFFVEGSCPISPPPRFLDLSKD
jgi:hypothetical protein